jgi:hypothetical protein
MIRTPYGFRRSHPLKRRVFFKAVMPWLVNSQSLSGIGSLWISDQLAALRIL